MRKLRILILSDGRPGHFNISEGVAAALGRQFQIEIVRLDVRRGRWSGAILAGLVNAGTSPAFILERIYGLNTQTLPGADLVISAGAETLAANVAVARLMGVPNIFYGSLRLFAGRHFALALTSYEKQVRHPNQAMALKPSRIDADALPPRPGGLRAGGLLIGGDGGRVRFRSADWERLIRFIEASHASLGLRWLVSNSRRTPDGVSDEIGARARGDGSMISQFVDVRRPESGNLMDVFRGADVTVVTADSSTMISEAVQLRRPVITVAPDRYWLEPDEARYRRFMHENGWLRHFSLSELTPEAFRRSLGEIRPMQKNALDRLADLITARLPTLGQFARRP